MGGALDPSSPDAGEQGLNDESSRESVINQGVSSARPLILRNKDILVVGPTVKFVENGVVTGEVPYEEEHVNFQAREYASQGKILSLSQGGHFLWEDCFNSLERTENSTVFVSSSV
jgi:hypothetical protein